MDRTRAIGLLVIYLDNPGSEEAFRNAREELSQVEADALFNLAVAANSAGLACSVNMVPHCNIQRVLAEKVPPSEEFSLCFYRNAHLVGLKVIALGGVIFDEVVRCGPGVLKPLFEAAVEKLPGLDVKSVDKPQFVGWALRQVPLPCSGWDATT